MELKSNKVIKSNKFDSTERIVIFLHGYGATGEDFIYPAQSFLAKTLDNTMFLFPDAPFACDAGFGRQWFSLNEMSYQELRSGLHISAPILNNYINKLSTEYSCDNINLIGFSQGSILSFEMLFYANITKVIAYSGLFAMPNDKKIISPSSKVLIVHSEDDEVVPYNNVNLAKNNLISLGIEPEVFTDHNVGHSVSLDGWKAAAEFIRK